MMMMTMMMMIMVMKMTSCPANYIIKLLLMMMMMMMLPSVGWKQRFLGRYPTLSKMVWRCKDVEVDNDDNNIFNVENFLGDGDCFSFSILSGLRLQWLLTWPF